MRGTATPCHQDGQVAGTPATPTPAIPAAGLGQELSKAAPWCLVGAPDPSPEASAGRSQFPTLATPLPGDFQASPARARLFSCFSTGS